MAYAWEHLTREEKAALLQVIADGGGGAGAGGGANIVPPPRVVELSWQDRCNIDCFFCSTSEIRAGNFELSGERLEGLFGQMRDLGVKGVRLMGGGEPLFRKDTEPLIRKLGANGLRIADVTTNGVLLTEPVVRALYATGCDEICVSLNTGNAESYGAMMQTTPKNFGRVLENVRRAAAIKRETGADCRIRLQFLIYQDNYRQIPEMARVFRESGADTFWLNGLYPVRPMPTMSESDLEEMLRLYEALVEEDYLEHLEGFSFWEQSISDRIGASTRAAFERAPLARRARIKLRHALTSGRRRAEEVAQLHEFCLVGWYSMTLNANGDAVTCCILQDHKTAVLGNIHRSSLEEIWLGPAYARFRGELREIMARRGAVEDSGHACVVEGLCARKGACPNRSYYWSDDLKFRREFHRTVEALPEPDGAPFATLPGGAPRLPVVQSPALPVR